MNIAVFTRHPYPVARPTLEYVQLCAYQYGYAMLDYQENINMVSFVKQNVRINVYLTKMTVGVCEKGSPQIFKKNVNSHYLEQIFINQ